MNKNIQGVDCCMDYEVVLNRLFLLVFTATCEKIRCTSKCVEV